MKNWSEKETRILKKLYKNTPNKEIAKLLDGKSVDAVANKARTLNLKKEDTSWTEKEIDILKNNYSTKNIDELKKMLPNRSEKTIRTNANLLKLKKASKWNKNEDTILLNNYENLGARECAKLLDSGKHSESQIKRRAYELGLNYKGNSRTIKWTKEDDDYLLKLWQENPTNKYELAMEKFPNRSKDAIKLRAILLNKKNKK